MKQFFQAAMVFFGLASLPAWATDKTLIICDNAPETDWGTYYCFQGTLDGQNLAITGVQFGTCEGSMDAGESDPVQIEELALVSRSEKLNSKSELWKDALAFDLATPTFGKASLFIRPGDVSWQKSKSDFAVRVELEKAPTEGALAQDAELHCH